MNLLNKNNWKIFSLLLVLTLLLAACSDDKKESSDDGKEEGTATGEPREGGTVVGAMDTAPTGMFNPIFYEEAYDENILDFTHESLVGQNEELEFVPKLAKDWEVSDDQKEITFFLEEGVKWHDGEEFTADDVVFTYKAMSDPLYVKSGGFRTEYVQALKDYDAYNSGEIEQFESVVAQDEYTVVFKFEEPNVTPLYTAGFPIIPEHVFGEMSIADIPKSPASLEGGKIIGTGPFKLATILEREQYVLESHEDYWQGKPLLDKIIWKIVDESIMMGLLETGEIDFIADPNGVSPADYETVEGMAHINVIEQPQFGNQFLGFKMNYRSAEDIENKVINPDNWKENETISDIEVRHAIAYAINREGIIEGLLYGRGQKTNSSIAHQFWAYDEDASIDYEYDPEKAEQLLDEAGYVDVNNDGFREDTAGNEWIMNMDYPTGNKVRERMAPIIAQQLEAVGIQVNVRQPKEMSTFIDGLENNDSDWDLFLLGWGLDNRDPDPSSLWASTAPYNYSRWNNPESDKLLEEAMKAPEAFELEHRKEKYKEWQKVFSEDLPSLFLYVQDNIWAVNTRMEGVVPYPYSISVDSHKWWVNAE